MESVNETIGTFIISDLVDIVIDYLAIEYTIRLCCDKNNEFYGRCGILTYIPLKNKANFFYYDEIIFWNRDDNDDGVPYQSEEEKKQAYNRYTKLVNDKITDMCSIRRPFSVNKKELKDEDVEVTYRYILDSFKTPKELASIIGKIIDTSEKDEYEPQTTSVWISICAEDEIVFSNENISLRDCMLGFLNDKLLPEVLSICFMNPTDLPSQLPLNLKWF